MTKAFIDTDIFYNILSKNRARRESTYLLLEEYEDYRFYTSLTVVNELPCISTAKYYRERGIAKGPPTLKKLVAKRGYPRNHGQG